MKSLILLTALFALFLSSCAAAPPSQTELDTADYGTHISQEDAQALAEGFLTGHLKDPGSAQYQWGTVYKGYLTHAPIHGGRHVFGYILEVQVNAKNSYGGYVGFKPYRFVFYNGSIKTVYGDRDGYMMKIM
ncbi:MAG: hypothetical protein KOO63_14450 [Bacteroidales bacterium]|nr:hypothetical protein [Candidatus Latescibacterota bacterium]